MSQHVHIDPKIRQDLVDAAHEAATKSYSPYSKFRVGAAVSSESGNIFTGTNVENISYGLTSCAERVAIGNAVSCEGPRLRIKAIAVVSSAQVPTPPCGACRQVIQEFGYDALVIYTSFNGFTESLLSELLPGPFNEIVLTQEDGGGVMRIQAAK